MLSVSRCLNLLDEENNYPVGFCLLFFFSSVISWDGSPSPLSLFSFPPSRKCSSTNGLSCLFGDQSLRCHQIDWLSRPTRFLFFSLSFFFLSPTHLTHPPVGYHQLLYASPVENRRLLSWLITQLPSNESEVGGWREAERCFPLC